MSEESSLYPLLNLHTGEPEEACLHHSILEQHILDVENSWKPILQEHVFNLKEKHGYGSAQFDKQKFSDEVCELMIQDAHWDWSEKYDYYSSLLGYSSCCLTCDDKIQGIGFFDHSENFKSKIIKDKTMGIVYVEYIATAPWNRKEIESQRYAGIGEVLITYAIEVSFDEGMNGRIGLHSLPQAEKFYKEKCNMEDFGIDKDKNMKYFEMSEEQAAEWLSKIQ